MQWKMVIRKDGISDTRKEDKMGKKKGVLRVYSIREPIQCRCRLCPPCNANPHVLVAPSHRTNALINCSPQNASVCFPRIAKPSPVVSTWPISQNPVSGPLQITILSSLQPPPRPRPSRVPLRLGRGNAHAVWRTLERHL